jgi:hypothetical protein
VLPPETRVDPSKPVQFEGETANWKEAVMHPDGFLDLRNGQGFNYPENACAFALAYVFVDAGTPARFWLGSDDGHTLYLNDELLEKRDTHRGFRFDDDFADGTLRSGWNRVLVKVHNSGGGWGMLLRIARPDGKPLAFRQSIEDMEAKVVRAEAPKSRAFPIVSDDFKGGVRPNRWLVTVGKFDTQNGMLRPRDTQRFGLWYRFKVDPDKPKDGPANLVWLQSPDMARADSLDMEIVVAAAKDGKFPPKFGFTIDGECENDGQSGHTFVLDDGERGVACHWYRYDRLLYLQQGVEVKPAPSYTVRLLRDGRKWRLTVNDVALFDDVDAPRLPHLGFGVMTWGTNPEIDSIKLARLEVAR